MALLAALGIALAFAGVVHPFTRVALTPVVAEVAIICAGGALWVASLAVWLVRLRRAESRRMHLARLGAIFVTAGLAALTAWALSDAFVTRGIAYRTIASAAAGVAIALPLARRRWLASLATVAALAVSALPFSLGERVQRVIPALQCTKSLAVATRLLLSELPCRGDTQCLQSRLWRSASARYEALARAAAPDDPWRDDALYFAAETCGFPGDSRILRRHELTEEIRGGIRLENREHCLTEHAHFCDDVRSGKSYPVGLFLEDALAALDSGEAAEAGRRVDALLSIRKISDCETLKRYAPWLLSIRARVHLALGDVSGARAAAGESIAAGADRWRDNAMQAILDHAAADPDAARLFGELAMCEGGDASDHAHCAQRREALEREHHDSVFAALVR